MALDKTQNIPVYRAWGWEREHDAGGTARLEDLLVWLGSDRSPRRQGEPAIRGRKGGLVKGTGHRLQASQGTPASHAPAVCPDQRLDL